MIEEDQRGVQLQLTDAVKIFQSLPVEIQLSSLNPAFAKTDELRDPRLSTIHWYFESNGNIFLHSFMLGKSDVFDVVDIQSPFGYGGPLANTSEPSFIETANNAFKQWIRDNAVVVSFLRFHPLVPHRKWFVGEVQNNREVVIVDLANDVFNGYKLSRRADVKLSSTYGLRIEQVKGDAMTKVFPLIYNENMNRARAGSEYYFTGHYFNALHNYPGCDNWLIYANETVVGGAVFLVSQPAKVAEYFLGAQTALGQSQKATIALLHYLAIHYKRLGYRYMYLGGGRSTSPNDSLLFFKKGFSPLSAQYQIGHNVYDPRRYRNLQLAAPTKASSGRILFYRD